MVYLKLPLASTVRRHKSNELCWTQRASSKIFCALLFSLLLLSGLVFEYTEKYFFLRSIFAKSECSCIRRLEQHTTLMTFTSLHHLAAKCWNTLSANSRFTSNYNYFHQLIQEISVTFFVVQNLCVSYLFCVIFY